MALLDNIPSAMRARLRRAYMQSTSENVNVFCRPSNPAASFDRLKPIAVGTLRAKMRKLGILPPAGS